VLAWSRVGTSWPCLEAGARGPCRCIGAAGPVCGSLTLRCSAGMFGARLRACLGVDWRRTDLGLRHLERRVVSEHCLGEGADPDACTCPACTVRRAGPAPGLSCHRGLFHPAPTAAWVAGVAYSDRAHMAHRRVLAASLRYRFASENGKRNRTISLCQHSQTHAGLSTAQSERHAERDPHQRFRTMFFIFPHSAGAFGGGGGNITPQV
jgi:hypothetical protein